MASILSEYVSKKLGVLDLQQELQRLISEYNKLTGRYMFIYSSDINKGRTNNIDVSLVQDDFYVIQDILRQSPQKKIDFYIETPGGSGEAAEEIAKFLRKKFDEVNFVIAGEAKSAGTILCLSGDNIYMTDTGSLGPIDAQVKIGRSVFSAHDYKAWVDEKKDEAKEKGSLNPFDAIMVAQISPGELYGVINSLEFAKDLVKEWLEKFKFKNWVQTETKKTVVTDAMRKQRANEVAEMFCNHTTWRTHGRSLKIEDLDEVLKIEHIDKNATLADIVYRIKTIIRMIFDASTIYKLFVLDDFILTKTFAINNQLASSTIPVPLKKPLDKQIERIEMEVECPKCRKKHTVPGYLDVTSEEVAKLKLPVNANIKDNGTLICDGCNFTLDLKPVKNHLETQIKKKITLQ